MTDPRRASSSELDAALRRLGAALDELGATGSNAESALQELEAFSKESLDLISWHPLLLAELDAIARRLGTLAGALPADDRWELDETVEQAAEVLRELRREGFRQRLEKDPQQALQLVARTLAQIPDEEVELLLGASLGELPRWLKDGVPPAKSDRVRLLSQILLDLRRSMSPLGMAAWFTARRAKLDGHTPLEILDVGLEDDRERLRRLARAPHSVQAV